MSTESNFQIPSGYERGIRFGANWTCKEKALPAKV